MIYKTIGLYFKRQLLAKKNCVGAIAGKYLRFVDISVSELYILILTDDCGGLF